MRRALVVALVIMLAAACDRSPSQVLQPRTSATANPGLEVGKALALALNDQTVRATIIEIMRTSPIVEHRVWLADALAAKGGVLANRAAAAAGVSPGALTAAVARLGRMEFYLAQKEYRRSWTASGAPAIVAFSTDHKNWVATDERGVKLDRQDTPTGPVFIVAPVEAESYRIDRAQDRPSSGVIEDANDGGGGLIIEVRGVLGQVLRRVDVGREGVRARDVDAFVKGLFADVRRSTVSPLAECDPNADNCGGGGGGGGDVVPTTRTEIEYFKNNLITDIDWPFISGTDVELELKTWQKTGTSQCCETKIRWEGVPKNTILIGDPATGDLCEGFAGCINGPIAAFIGSVHPTSTSAVRCGRQTTARTTSTASTTGARMITVHAGSSTVCILAATRTVVGSPAGSRARTCSTVGINI